MPSTDDATGLSGAVRTVLLEIARHAIRHGLQHAGPPPPPDLQDLPPACQVPGAAFVTLKTGGALRGCIGSLEVRQALAADVSAHAYDAAFRDPRFPPLKPHEAPGLDLHISVLSPHEALEVDSQADLLQKLRPGRDGLVLEEDGHRGTFLPAVWEDLPDPAVFVAHLKRKAGLPSDYWSDRLRFRRYTVEAFGGPCSG